MIYSPASTRYLPLIKKTIKRGKLQDFIFDNRLHASHRALAAVLGVVLRLPPVKRSAASSMLGSRYVESMIDRLSPY